jgi:arginyl-tRNA synthetase
MAREALPSLPQDAQGRANFLDGADLTRLTDEGERALMRKIAQFPRVVEAAAESHEPHRIAFYLYELASEFHGQWTKGTGSPNLRFIIQEDSQLTTARLALVQGVVTVLAAGLALLGVTAPDEMR